MVLTDGSTLAADEVVVGIGVAPAVGWLQGAGVPIDDGVVCDQSLTVAEGVVACGDVARWSWRHHGVEELVRIEHWQVAAEEGVAAARSLLAGRTDAPGFDPVPYFWSDQYRLRIQMLGHPSADDDMVVVDGSLDDDRFAVIYGRDGRLTGVLGISRPRAVMAYRPLLEAGAGWDESLALARA